MSLFGALRALKVWGAQVHGRWPVTGRQDVGYGFFSSEKQAQAQWCIWDGQEGEAFPFGCWALWRG